MSSPAAAPASPGACRSILRLPWSSTDIPNRRRADDLDRITTTIGAVFAASLAPFTFAGDCNPQWDLDFGLPGASGGIVFDFAATTVVRESSSTRAGASPRSAVYPRAASRGGTARRGARWAAASATTSATRSRASAAISTPLATSTARSASREPRSSHAGTERPGNPSARSSSSSPTSSGISSPGTTATGEALYVAGNYQNVGGVTNASFISKWDGESFSALGTPIGGAVPLIIFTAYVWDDGTGEALYVGGRFLTIDGVSASRIAKWDGDEWSGSRIGPDRPRRHALGDVDGRLRRRHRRGALCRRSDLQHRRRRSGEPHRPLGRRGVERGGCGLRRRHHLGSRGVR